jgi:excisionase family DNA binding protein
MKNYLTTAEAAAEIGVTASRVRQLILAGDLAAEKIGRDLVVKARDLKKYKRPKLGRPPGKK